MSWIRRLWNRRRLERELDKEVRFHVEGRVDDLVKQGVEPVEARRRAALEFGGAEQVKEACRDER